jgi:hypothetical protein
MPHSSPSLRRGSTQPIIRDGQVNPAVAKRVKTLVEFVHAGGGRVDLLTNVFVRIDEENRKSFVNAQGKRYANFTAILQSVGGGEAPAAARAFSAPFSAAAAGAGANAQQQGVMTFSSQRFQLTSSPAAPAPDSQPRAPATPGQKQLVALGMLVLAADKARAGLQTAPEPRSAARDQVSLASAEAVVVALCDAPSAGPSLDRAVSALALTSPDGARLAQLGRNIADRLLRSGGSDSCSRAKAQRILGVCSRLPGQGGRMAAGFVAQMHSWALQGWLETRVGALDACCLVLDVLRGLAGAAREDDGLKVRVSQLLHELEDRYVRGAGDAHESLRLALLALLAEL